MPDIRVTKDLTDKVTPANDDKFAISDSADLNDAWDAESGKLKRLSWANLKLAISGFYNTLTATFTNKTIDLWDNTITTTKAQLDTAVSDGTPIYEDTLDSNISFTKSSLSLKVSNGTPLFVWDPIWTSSLTKEFTLWEDVDAWDALRLGISFTESLNFPDTFIYSGSQQDIDTFDVLSWSGVINSITTEVFWNGSTSDITLYITDTSNNVLFTSDTQSAPFWFNTRTFTFTWVSLSAWNYKLRWTATSSGWRVGTNNTGNYTMTVSEDSSKYYKCNSSDNKFIDFYWFASSSWLADEQIDIVFYWIYSGFTWITQWNTYYLSDTPWEISNTPWTIPVEIGTAVSATELQILDKTINSEVVVFSRLWNEATWSVTYSHNGGKRPKMIKFDMIYGLNSTQKSPDSHWVWDWVNNYSIVNRYNATPFSLNTHCISLYWDSSNTQYQRASVSSVTDNDFTLDWEFLGWSSWLYWGTMQVLATLFY